MSILVAPPFMYVCMYVSASVCSAPAIHRIFFCVYLFVLPVPFLVFPSRIIRRSDTVIHRNNSCLRAPATLIKHRSYFLLCPVRGSFARLAR